MPIIFAFTALFVFQLIGEITVRTLNLPLPGPLAGMMLLFVALLIHKKIPPALEHTANTLIQHLMLLFIPAVAGVMLYVEQLKAEWLPFLLTGVIGTALTLIVTAVTLSTLLNHKHKQKQKEKKKENNND